MSDLALADLVVAIHVGYVAFVVVGQILILIGLWRRWDWVRNRWFRCLHLLAILIVAGEALFNVTCPLTTWEARLRQAAGQQVSQGTFVGNLLHHLIFFDAPDWVFNMSYVLFAVLVGLTFWFAPPEWKPREAMSQSLDSPSYNYCNPFPEHSRNVVASAVAAFEEALCADIQGGLAMNPGIAELFRSVTVTEPRTAGGLTVFGLRTATPSKLNYTTLDDALKSETLTITEISEGGSVPTLKLTNKTGRRVFLMAGEQLIGSKQNRVLNTSLLVEVDAEIPIPVSCVEQGRWAYRSEKFTSHGTSSPGELRKLMSRDVSRFYLTNAAPASDQGAVWAKVAQVSACLGTRSDSGAMEQIYEDHGPKLEENAKKLECPEGCNGVVFVRKGQVVGADVFDQPETLRKLWTKLLRAQFLDILAESDTTAAILEPAVVRQWLDSAAKSEAKAYQSPALGEDVRLKGEHVAGAGLVVEEQPVHVQVFAE